ncbi:MAG: hypothetical protein ACFFAH_16110 [Promethearchaeota archaeon]
MIELYILLIMAIIMFITAAGILYVGHKKGTPNLLLWAFFPLVRGIHQLIEFIADYNEEILDRELFFFDRFEIFSAFCSTFVLLAACLEFNETIRKPFGKLIVLIVAIIPLYLILTVSDATLNEFEDQLLFEGFILTSDPPRFLYGFILPLISATVIIGTYVYYRYQDKRGIISHNPKMKKITLIIVLLILSFSIFEGFDYEEHELIFTSFRAVTLSLFIIIPLFIIYTIDLGLQRFFIIDHSGLPLYIFNFQTNESALSEELSFLTSGFLTAIINFSDELSTKKSGFLSIRSQYLYYSILKTEKKLYALQSILFNKNLEETFFSSVKQIDDMISEMDKTMIKDSIQVKDILDKQFLPFY